MIKHKKNKKTIAYICAICLFFGQTFPLGAGAATTLSSLFDTSTGEVDFSGIDDMFKTIDSKSSSNNPQVKLSFSSTDNFKVGSSVTAKTVTSGFSDENPIYYTWYLKREGCELTDDWWKTETWCEENYLESDAVEDCKDKKAKETKQSKIEICDLDGDELITPNDWKIAATRIAIKGDFDKNSADYSKLTVEESASGTKAVPSVREDDGWVKNFERDDSGDLKQENDEDAPNCYMTTEESGTTYELRNTKVSFSNTCPSGYHAACVGATTASCDTLNPAYPTTDQDCPPWIEESDPAYDPDLCTDPVEKTISTSFNVCAANSNDQDAESVFGCTIESEDDLEDYKASLSCRNSSGTPICIEDDGIMNLMNTDDTDNVADSILGVITSMPGTNAENETNGICSALANENTYEQSDYDDTDPEYYRAAPPNFLNTADTSINESCSYLVDGLVNGITQDRSVTIEGYTDTIPDGITIAEGNSDLQPTCSFAKDTNLCKHLFPYFPEKKIETKKLSISMSDDDMAGDGKFTLNEKKFWGANPKDSETNGTNKDEAVVIGLGIKNFTWIYSEGDEVGVAVEGTTFIPTDHKDSSTKIMWAFSKGTCSALEEEDDDIENGRRAFYKEDGVNILTSNFDLDRCLEENLTDPTTNEYGIGEMTIDLLASPENPINDPGGNGDTLTVAAGIQNVSDSGSVYYEWSIEKSEDGSISPNDDTSWTDITTDVKKNGSIKNSDIAGIGKNKLIFPLDLPASLVDPDGQGAFYLKIRVKATESVDSNNETTQGSVTIRVRQQENKLVAYSVVVSADGEMKIDKGEGAFCDSTSGEACDVAQNKIIGVELPKNDDEKLTGISWTVNSASMSCTSDMSEDCSEGDVLIFPVLGEPGEAINVIGKGLSSKTGGVVEVNLYFLIVKPELKIVTTNTAKVWPKLMGFFKDTDEGKTADYSSYVFETNTGNEVSLRADTSGVWGYFGQTFVWSIDGGTYDSYGNTASFIVDKEAGDSYDVSVTMEEERTEENSKKINYLRKALYDNWGVSVDDLGDESLVAAVQINVVDNTYQTVSDSGEGALFASLATNLPKQLMFLFKIALTGIIFMFSISIIFAIIPESIFEKREEKIGF